MGHSPRCSGTSVARMGRTYNLKLSQSGHRQQCGPVSAKHQTTETANKIVDPDPGLTRDNLTAAPSAAPVCPGGSRVGAAAWCR
jgi:hypothetical protein